MSGGTYDYGYYKLEQYEGCMKDDDLNEMIRDLKVLLHDLEWCDSGDTNIFDYAKSANIFKEKWMPGRDKVIPVVDRRWEVSNHYDDILYHYSHLPLFHVAHFDYKANGYITVGPPTTFKQALEDFDKARPTKETDRVELVFMPTDEQENYNDDIVMKYKVESEEGQM